jgi:DNA-3-methyladenine glycosylase I
MLEVMSIDRSLIRCGWCEGQLEEYIKYHDEEWGVPVHDDRRHFEFLILESAQAGLSWSTILKRRMGYKNAFAGFDAEKVARFDEKRYEDMLQDRSIIRNRLKIKSAINNAKRFIKVQEVFGSFDNYIWGFTGGSPIFNAWEKVEDVPARTELSDLVSKDLQDRGFTFVGSTIIYAHLQATGIVNDHVTSCFRYKELNRS